MKRRWFLLGSVGLIFIGLWALGVRLSELVPSAGGRKLAAEFFGAALQPALTFEDGQVGQETFLGKVIESLLLTFRYAVAAMSLALVFGVVGGALGSRAWWVRASWPLRWLRRAIRLVATGARSVHELMWALLFVSAAGTSPLAAVLALALPFGGTLAKVFSELLDEGDSSAKEVLQATGGTGMASFLAVVVRALPDLLTYGLYRFECSIRSSAILGFVGIPTLGYHLAKSWEDGHYHEVWSYLYALLAVVILFERLGAVVRKRLTEGVLSGGNVPEKVSFGERVRALYQARPRSYFLRGFIVFACVSMVWAWVWQSQWSSGVSLERRVENVQRFLGELKPFPVRESDSWEELMPWLGEHLSTNGVMAVWATFHLATVGVLLAAGVGFGLILWTARTLATARPQGVPVERSRWRVIPQVALRAAAVVGRSLPEFILAFLLLQIFGPTVWALILALAIHNGCILLRLGSEVVENTSRTPGQVLIVQGGSRASVFLAALLPASFNRLVLFLFYRWETCIREATVLGMLGVSSIGFLISEARVRFFYDEMLLWIILGAGLVMAGDLVSDWVRSQFAKGAGSAGLAAPRCR